MKRIALTIALLSLACSSAPPQPEPAPDTEPTIIYLVRHAEKESGQDPALTSEGKKRASALARLLSDVKIDAVYSTDYRRTRDTAKPVLERRGLRLETYDPTELADFAAALLARPAGTYLVVGHSNTTPQLVAALGGEPGPPIVEATEYDRLYVLYVDGEDVKTQLLRFDS